MIHKGPLVLLNPGDVIRLSGVYPEHWNTASHRRRYTTEAVADFVTYCEHCGYSWYTPSGATQPPINLPCSRTCKLCLQIETEHPAGRCLFAPTPFTPYIPKLEIISRAPLAKMVSIS